MKELTYYSQLARLSSFKNWPYSKNSTCSAEKMAEAGFYMVNAGDCSAQCFFCGKMLEGFEETDDPWTEHEEHMPKKGCIFIQNGKPEKDMTLKDHLEMWKAMRVAEVVERYEQHVNFLGDLQEIWRKKR